jgi:hypothetical protein
MRGSRWSGTSPEARYALAHDRLAAQDAERSAWLDRHKNEGAEKEHDPWCPACGARANNDRCTKCGRTK